MDRELNEEELQDLYAWIDKIPLSRPKRHITRDFSDGVMAAEEGVFQAELSMRRRRQIWNTFDTRNHEKPHAEIRQAEAKLLAQVTGEEKKKDEKSRLRNSKPQHTVQFYTDMDPTLRTVLQEKEQAVMALQETVEILQMKVNRLEHLIHLKDMRIEDLTRHLETYKSKGNTR
ncbi:sperm flagellar protein 1 [Lates japonicus]|uniref:Sperm flagellar protein 1 n=1 Tax=Lates japonicus TaxID=270547 RepID=A0AAD3N816_LATJO|nr:sperm flagellar protein 1 [Lates japonicus]